MQSGKVFQHFSAKLQSENITKLFTLTSVNLWKNFEKTNYVKNSPGQGVLHLKKF